jgi:hypothetical protein
MIKSNLTLTPNLPFLYALLKYNYDPSAHLLKQLRITWGSSYEYKRVSFDERPSFIVMSVAVNGKSRIRMARYRPFSKRTDHPMSKEEIGPD